MTSLRRSAENSPPASDSDPSEAFSLPSLSRTFVNSLACEIARKLEAVGFRTYSDAPREDGFYVRAGGGDPVAGH
jgi:hypothetical protein